MVGTFNQSLQCTQDVFVGFQAPSPPVAEVQSVEDAFEWGESEGGVPKVLTVEQTSS